MQDMINLAMLVCATVASLAFGVLIAHAMCRAAFTILRVHSASVAESRIEAKLEKAQPAL